MRRLVAAALVALPCLVAGPAPPAAAAAAAAAAVTGTVRTILRPLAGVHVLAPETGAYAVSDSTGRFVLAPLGAGTFALRLVAVGYQPVEGSIVVPPGAVAAGTTLDVGSWLLSPLRPDDVTPGFRVTAATTADSAARLADSLAALPAPAPLGPPLALLRTRAEATRWPPGAALVPAADGPASAAGAFADLLRRIAVADSMTAATGGTAAPGFETWRQWGDRLEVFAGDSARAVEPLLAVDSSLVVRAVAYARTRAALAAGPTHAGYALAARARADLSWARRVGRGADAAFLARLGEELDRVFVPGSTPPPAPKPAPARRRSRRSRSGR